MHTASPDTCLEIGYGHLDGPTGLHIQGYIGYIVTRTYRVRVGLIASGQRVFFLDFAHWVKKSILYKNAKEEEGQSRLQGGPPPPPLNFAVDIDFL